MYICMHVLLSAILSITFESLNVESSFLVLRYILTWYGSSSYVKVIGSRSRSQEQKRAKIPITTIVMNSCSITHIAVKFARSMSFSATADRMVWPPFLSRDRKWPRVTKCTHSGVVGLRLEGNLVYNKGIDYSGTIAKTLHWCSRSGKRLQNVDMLIFRCQYRELSQLSGR